MTVVPIFTRHLTQDTYHLSMHFNYQYIKYYVIYTYYLSQYHILYSVQHRHPLIQTMLTVNVYTKILNSKCKITLLIKIT